MAEKMTPKGLIVGLIPEEETPQEQAKPEEKAPVRSGRKAKDKE